MEDQGRGTRYRQESIICKVYNFHPGPALRRSRKGGHALRSRRRSKGIKSELTSASVMGRRGPWWGSGRHSLDITEWRINLNKQTLL